MCIVDIANTSIKTSKELSMSQTPLELNIKSIRRYFGFNTACCSQQRLFAVRKWLSVARSTLIGCRVRQKRSSNLSLFVRIAVDKRSVPYDEDNIIKSLC